MDNRTIKLLPASFRGVPFSVRNEYKTRDGRRHIIIEFPNSKKRAIQDLGEIPPEFSVDAFVHGEDWLQRGERLRNALRQRGAGRLILPTFGAVLVYALGDFKENSRHISIGEISITLNFVVASELKQPARAELIIEDVFDSGDVSREALHEDVGERWIEPKDVNSIEVANYDFQAFLETLDSTINKIVGTNNEYSRRLFTATASVASIVRKGQNLADTLFGINGLFNAFSLFLGGTVAAFESMINLAHFGSGLPTAFTKIRGAPNGSVIPDSFAVPLWDSNTIQRIRRNANRETFLGSIRAAALVVAYEQAASSEYTTKKQIQDVREKVETAYFALFQGSFEDPFSLLNNSEIKRTVNTVRTASLTILERKEQQAFGLTDFTALVGESVINLVYSLYAEEFTTFDALEERVALMRELNPDQPSVNYVGDFDIFQVETGTT